MTTILCDIQNGCATITLNRPESMNTFNLEFGHELAEITDKIARDSTVRVVVLKGNGAAFMAGGNIQFFADQLHKMPEGVPETVRLLAASIRNLRMMPKPVLAVVHGAVAGAGISIMLATDLVLAEENTVFTLAYSGIGLSPDGAASFMLPKTVGTKRAMELTLLSERFNATRALELGLINWTSSAADLATTQEKLIKKLANGPTLAYAQSKHLINSASAHSLEDHFEHELQAFAKCSVTHDFQEGVHAFLENRKAAFTGN